MTAMRVLFRVEVKDCVLPKAPAALINAPLSICFEHGHKLAATSDRSLLTKAGEHPRVASFPRETLALVVVLKRDARGKFAESAAHIVVRMRRHETHYKGLAIAELALHQILASSESAGGASSEIKVPLKQCPWPLTAAEANSAYIIVTVTSRVIGAAVLENGIDASAQADSSDEVTSADFGYDSENERLNPPQTGSSSSGATTAVTNGSGIDGASKNLEFRGDSSKPKTSSSAGSASPARLKSSNPYSAAINAAVASNGAFKKKCEVMASELRVLKREHEESSKLKQALKALQGKFDAASRDLAEQAEIVGMQTAALKAKTAPEVANLTAQLAARDGLVSSLQTDLDALRKGKPPGAADPSAAALRAQIKDLEMQLKGAAAARDQATRDKERLGQNLEATKRMMEETSVSLLKTKHQYSGSLSKPQVIGLQSDLEMTKAQLKASLDLIDALMQLQLQSQSGDGEGETGTKPIVTESDLRAILTAASARGKELADMTAARDELQQNIANLSRQLMAARRSSGGPGVLTYGSVVNGSREAQTLEGWSEAQFSDWTEQEAVISAEAETASIFLPEGLASSASAGDSSEEVLALEAKLQTCSAQLKLRESQLANCKTSLEAAKQASDRQKAEIAELSQKMQSGLSFINSFDAKLSESNAQVTEISQKYNEAVQLSQALQDQLAETRQELDAARARASSSAKLAFSPSSGPPANAADAVAIVAEYEEKLQQAASYVAYQDEELTKERTRISALERRVTDLEREKRELQTSLQFSQSALSEAREGLDAQNPGGIHHFSASINSTRGPTPTGFASSSDSDLEGQLREAQDKARVLKRDAERQKLEFDELRDLLEVRDEHIRAQQKKLRALEAGRSGRDLLADSSAAVETEESYESKTEKGGTNKFGETKAVLNRRVTALEDELNAVLLKNRAQEDKLTKAAEYIKYQKEQLTAYMDQLTSCSNEIAGLREQLAAVPPPQEGPTEAELELTAELDEVRGFAEEFETKLVEAAEFIDQQAAEIASLQAALDKERRERLAAITVKSTVSELPKQPALPYLNSRNDPENIDFDECMEYLRRIDLEAARARKQEMSLSTENLSLQASLKQALAAAAAAATPIYHAPPPPPSVQSLQSFPSVGGEAALQIKEARDVAKKLAAEKTKLETTVTQLREQLKSGPRGSGAVGGGSSSKYDDFDVLVNDLINYKMELSAVRDELEEAQRKNRDAADAIRTITKLQEELNTVKTAKTLLEKGIAEGSMDIDASLVGTGGGSGGDARSSVRASLGGEDNPHLQEAREVARKYFGELQAAKLQISALHAELETSKVVRGVSRKGGDGTPGVGPLSDAEREALVKELIETKMQIDALTSELEDERGKTADLVSRLNQSTKKIASLEARLGNSTGSHEPSRNKGIKKFGFSN